MNPNLDLHVRIAADVSRYVAGTGAAQRSTRAFADTVQTQFARIKGFMGSTGGLLAGVGLGMGVSKMQQEVARFEKEMRLLQVSTGDSRGEMENWRKDMLHYQQTTGVTVDKQLELSNSLQAVGLNMAQIRGTLGPAANTMAVAKTTAESLGKALGVASEFYKFDLANPKEAAMILDKMLVAGRLGNAELQNLPDIFAKIGGASKNSKLSFDQTLAMVEALSRSEPQADRLGTQIDSLLRMFTNYKYLEKASKATGIKFFDKKGNRREAFDILSEFQKKVLKIKDEKGQLAYISKALGEADQNTLEGIRRLVQDGRLDQIKDLVPKIKNAVGTSANDLSIAIDNAVDQASRLKAVLGEAMQDGFARPLNEAFSSITKFALDKKENGGLQLNGKEMLLGGAAMLVGVPWLAGGVKRLAGGMSNATNTAAGVATGKALEAATGVKPVFVTNWPATLGGVTGADAGLAAVGGAAAAKVASKARTLYALAAGLPVSAWGSMGAAGLGTAAAGVTAAAAGGYAVGTILNKIGEFLAKDTRLEGTGTDVVGPIAARVWSMFGSEDAKRAIELTNKLKDTPLSGTINIQVSSTAGVNATVKAAPAARSPLSMPVGATNAGAL
jgi:TP901 family phage tail tape measure protein